MARSGPGAKPLSSIGAWGLLAGGVLAILIAGSVLGDDRVAAPGSFVGPDEALSVDGCVVCHAPEYKAWTTTPHYRSLEIPTTKPGRALSRQLGWKRGVVKDPFCTTCHFTVVRFHGADDPKYGVSCESCHGAAKAWVGVHGDQRTWPQDKRDERLRIAASKGMVRPVDLPAIARSCYLCHFLVKPPAEGVATTNESLANAVVEAAEGWQHPLAGNGAKRASPEGFELVSWSQGEVRHNFELSPSGVNRESDHRLCLYVVGKMLDLEFSVRGLAAATDRDGRFFRVLKERLVGPAGAPAKLRAVAAKLPPEDPIGGELRKLVSRIDEKELEPSRAGPLQALAEGVAAVSSALFGGKSEADLKALERSLAPIEPLLPARESYLGTPSKGS
jgi:hypothetical protein